MGRRAQSFAAKHWASEDQEKKWADIYIEAMKENRHVE